MAAVRRRMRNLHFPLAGLDRSRPYQQQPPFSTPDALNVRSRTPELGRARGGSRPGLRVSHVLPHPYEPSLLFGSAYPVTLLNQFVATDESGRRAFEDTFPDKLLGPHWLEYGEYDRPSVTHTLALPTAEFDEEVATVHTTTGFGLDPSRPYTVEAFLVPFDGAFHGTYRLFIHSGPDPANLGLEVQVDLAGTDGVASGQVINHTEDESWDLTEIGPDEPEPGWLTALVTDGERLRLYWHGYQLLDQVTTFSQSPNHFGFGIDCVHPGKMNLVGRYRMQYSDAEPRPESRRILVAGGGGVFLREERPGEMAIVDVDVRVASDRPVFSEEHMGKLYIADHGYAVSGDDGSIDEEDGDYELTAPSVSQWTDGAGLWPVPVFDKDSFVVLITDGTGSVVDGVYEIEAVTSEHLVLAGEPGEGSCTFRVERGLKVFDPSDDTLSLWHATEGLLPIGCPLIARYMDRIVLAGDPPNQWYMSRQGDPYDWDYGADMEDVGRAVSGATTEAGRVARPITALMPHGDDFMFFGCATELWLMRGDPVYGGRLDNVSRVVGPVGPNAWCWGPQGELYFLSRDGIYGVTPDARPQSMSRERLPRELQDLDQSRDLVNIEYDAQDRGVHIFVVRWTDIDAPEGMLPTRSHFFFDTQVGSYWPVELWATVPDNNDPHNHSPYVTCRYVAEGAEDSAVLLGGIDGRIRRFDRLAETDCGKSIHSYVVYGPIPFSEDVVFDGMIHELRAALGESSGPVNWSLRVAETAEAALDAPDVEMGTITAGKNLTARPNRRGRGYVVVLAGATDRRWVVENITAVESRIARQR